MRIFDIITHHASVVKMGTAYRAGYQSPSRSSIDLPSSASRSA